jgi:hypothetical protein
VLLVPHRRDRDQLTSLVNAHAAAVVPGIGVSVASVLSDLERQPEAFRGTGEIRWLVFWPEAPLGNPYWPDAAPAAEKLIGACVRQLEQWGVTRQDAGGDLPAPGVYGVPGSGRTSGRCTSGPVSGIRGIPMWSIWPGSRTCRVRPGR